MEPEGGCKYNLIVFDKLIWLKNTRDIRTWIPLQANQGSNAAFGLKLANYYVVRGYWTWVGVFMLKVEFLHRYVKNHVSQSRHCNIMQT